MKGLLLQRQARSMAPQDGTAPIAFVRQVVAQGDSWPATREAVAAKASVAVVKYRIVVVGSVR